MLRRAQREGRASMDSSLPATTERFGRAIFAAAQIARGPWTLLLEWKDYTHYLVAPTESARRGCRSPCTASGTPGGSRCGR